MAQPVQGYDVSISIVGPNGPTLVGEFQEVEINIKNDVETYLETNERIAQILDGEIQIDGKLKRGWFNMDIIKQVYGTASMQRGTKIPEQPRFTITCTVANNNKGLNGRIKLVRSIIPDLSLSVKSGKSIVDKSMNFRSEGIAA